MTLLCRCCVLRALLTLLTAGISLLEEDLDTSKEM